MIVRTEAIVLRAMDYGETSQIVTLYTRRHGTIAVIAKGARRPKSKFGSALQPMSYVQVVYYYKENRDLHTLSESAHVRPLLDISRSLEKLTVGLRIVELVRALQGHEGANPQMFVLLLHTLEALDAAEHRAGHLLPYFTMRLARELGFEPAFERTVVADLTPEGGLLVLENGAVAPVGLAEAGLRASRGALRAFAIFARADLETVLRMRLTPELYDETQALVEAYLRYHVEDAFPTRGGRVAEQLGDYRTPRSNG